MVRCVADEVGFDRDTVDGPPTSHVVVARPGLNLAFLLACSSQEKTSSFAVVDKSNVDEAFHVGGALVSCRWASARSLALTPNDDYNVL